MLMKDIIEDSHAIIIDNKDDDDFNKKYEDIFFLESNLASDFNISINEDSFMPFQRSDSLARTKPTTIATSESNLDSLSRSNSNSNYYSSIELKRKKNREASKASRKKKKEDIICLVKTNELLKERINKLKSQLDNNLCSQCQKRLSDQLANKLVSNDNSIEKQNKPGHLSSFATLSSSSSSSINPSPNRAKTAMFISVVVLFCVIVNSYSDKSRGYLRQVSNSNYYNDHISIIKDNNNKELNNVSQCFELLKYHYSITKPPFNTNQGLSFEQITDEGNKKQQCKEITISQEINGLYNFKVQADKTYLLWKIFNDWNNYNEEPNKPFYLECVHIRFDNLKDSLIIT